MKFIGEIIIFLLLFIFLYWIYSKLFDLVHHVFWTIKDKIAEMSDRGSPDTDV